MGHMEANNQKLNDLAFYFLMGILSVSVVYIIGYLLYDILVA